MNSFLKDARQSLRMFVQHPAFTIPAILALALGIGANTAIFSVVNTVLLKPLNYPDPDRLVQFVLTFPNGSAPIASVPNFMAWRSQTRLFTDVAGYDTGGPGLNLTGGAYPEQIRGVHVTANYFRLFGATNALGRTFSAEEDRPNGGHTVVLSYGFWGRRFGSDPTIIGKSISLGGDPYTVIGVTSARFDADPPADVWLPFQFDPNSTNQAHYFAAAGRLRRGVTLAAANAQLKIAAAEFRRNDPSMDARQGFGVQLLRDSIVNNVRFSLLILLAAVSFVLLIACANVANLLLVRATGRKREIAVRAAVGASRGRIVRQLLTESVLLFLGGGVLGLLVGILGVRALLAVSPGNIPRIGENGSAVTLDWRVLLFTLGVTLAVGLLFGLIPALNSSRADLGLTLKEGSSRSGTGFRQNKARALLVIAETALALVLLIGAVLLIRTFVALRHVNPGFDVHNVLTMDMSLTGERFKKTAGVAQLIRDGSRQLDTVPGVDVAGATCCLPLEGGFGLAFNIPGRPLTNGPFTGGAGWINTSPAFFDVFKIPLLRGRLYTDRDDGSAPGVVVINETMARQFWPKGGPLKDRLWIGHGMREFEEPPRQIIGVVADIHANGLDRAPQPTMYVPTAQVKDAVTALNARIGPIVWVVRTRVRPRTLSNAIETKLREASGGMPVAHIRSMEEVVVRSTARSDFNMLVLTIFGCSALLLAGIGIYGLMAYSVAQRTQEIGIRVALGAETSRVRNLVVVQGMRVVIVGIAVGVAAAFGLTRLLASFLFGVKSLDPLTFVAVPIFLALVALVAVWIPARRATHIDPLSALRYE